jgi:hypothetical protein
MTAAALLTRAKAGKQVLDLESVVAMNELSLVVPGARAAMASGTAWLRDRGDQRQTSGSADRGEQHGRDVSSQGALQTHSNRAAGSP